MKKIIPVFALFLLAACASEPPPTVPQEVDNSPKINLDVLTVVVVDRTLPDGKPTPYASNNFQPTIATAMRRWATDKLVAVGSSGEAFVVIRDASLHTEQIPHPESMFTREQTSKYAAHAQMELDITRRNEHGQVVAEASQFVTLPEDPSSFERKNAYNRVFNAIMADLGNNIRKGIQDHLSQFVATSLPAPY